MAERKPAKKETQQPADGTATVNQKARGFTDEERAAMRERARELKAEARRDPAAARAEGEREVLARIAEMPEPDRSLAGRIHALITSAAPDLVPRLRYGMPAYARDGNVVCHFQDARKFKMRYATLGFSDKAHLDDGSMWPNSYALTELTPADETRIAALVKRAVS